VLCALMRQFPFRILGFHSDNGSEFINRIVARLLNKLLIEQTISGWRMCRAIVVFLATLGLWHTELKRLATDAHVANNPYLYVSPPRSQTCVRGARSLGLL
jgi:transposase InsO family protein